MTAETIKIIKETLTLRIAVWEEHAADNRRSAEQCGPLVYADQADHCQKQAESVRDALNDFSKEHP